MRQFSTLQEVETTARSLMNKHKLAGWYFKFSNGAKIIGWCDPSCRTITISKKFFRINLDNGDAIIDTILHEIAHALDWVRNGNSSHGYSWKMICYEIGCNPERTLQDNTLNRPTLKYSLTCPKCGRVSQIARKPKRTKACGKCCRELNNGRYSSEFEMILTEN